MTATTLTHDLRIVHEPKPTVGPGRTVWLASYPKSGNTWMRAIVTALGTHRALFAVNQLGSGAQPHSVHGSMGVYGLDARWLQHHEVDQLRDSLVRRTGSPADPTDTATAPFLRKTHEIWRPGSPGAEPFPVAATRAAILVVRDPRDVACSYAPFFGLDLPGAVAAMGQDRPRQHTASPARLQTAQPWGTWSSHTVSWLSDDVPFPVHIVRFEDLKADAVATLAPVFAAVGMECTDDELTTAVAQARFDRLQELEQERGFREISPRTETFFRSGRAGGWRTELSPELIADIEADHAPAMTRLGYPLTTDATKRQRLARARESRRRQERTPWWQLPPELGLAVQQGPIPEELPGAQSPRPWIQVTPDQALVRFTGGSGLLVSNGRDVTVSWEPDPDHPDQDPSWLVQGWAVTLAMLQRGDLSLHAATVRIGDEIVAIAGHRGAGKSTTSMGLRQRGHQLLIDDVTLIHFRDGKAWTTPYSRNVHLLPDAAEATGLDFDALPLLAGGRKKVAFRAEDPPSEPQRIDRIVVLAPAPRHTDVTLTEARGTRRLQALLAHTSRDGIAPLVLGQQRYFDLMAQLSNAAPVFVLRRPRTGWTLDAVLDLIEESGSARRALTAESPSNPAGK